MRHDIARPRVVATLLLCLLAVAGATAARAQNLSYERERGRQMLQALKDDIKKNYYDENFHGVDLDARFKAADDRIRQASSPGQILAIIAQVMVDFDDSHLYFVPPPHSSRTEYGWDMQMIGERCFITAVRPRSDAEAKGLRPGDEVVSLDGYEPTRESLWKMNYYYRMLRPKASVKFVVVKPDGKRQELEVNSKVTEGRQIRGNILEDYAEFDREEESAAHLMRHRFYDAIPDLLIWKMPQFDLDEAGVDSVMDRARKHKALIIDLRGNGGGSVRTLERLIANLFDHDVKVGDRHGRKELKPEIARTRGGDNLFRGQLILLIDSNSGSAAELLARVVQLEKRGLVLGDRSAGAVMEATHYPHQVGVDIMTFYGASVTVADLIMADGKSLEKTGVVPDQLLLPSPAALAAGRDPVLARAVALLGFKLDPDKAGQLFPHEWPDK